LEARLLGRDRDKDKVPAVSSTKRRCVRVAGRRRRRRRVGHGHALDRVRVVAVVLPPTQLDAKRSTPYVDNVTRLEARLLGRDRDKDKVRNPSVDEHLLHP
jgi:hypothetical protein